MRNTSLVTLSSPLNAPISAAQPRRNEVGKLLGPNVTQKLPVKLNNDVGARRKVVDKWKKDCASGRVWRQNARKIRI